MHNYANQPPFPRPRRLQDIAYYIYVNNRAEAKLELRILWGIGKLKSI